MTYIKLYTKKVIIKLSVASGDAEVLIVKTAVESVSDKTMELVCKDVDLIIITTASCYPSKKLIF